MSRGLRHELSLPYGRVKAISPMVALRPSVLLDASKQDLQSLFWPDEHYIALIRTAIVISATAQKLS